MKKRHSISFYKRQIARLDNVIDQYFSYQDSTKIFLESYIRNYFSKKNDIKGASRATYDLFKYVNKDITRLDLLSKYSFLKEDNMVYSTIIQYSHNFEVLENLRKKKAALIKLVKEFYPEEVVE